MAKIKDFSVSINPTEVLYTSINTSKDGYNSARLVAKRADKQYLSVSFEWEGGGIPDFALDLVEFMKANNMETSGIWVDKEGDYTEFAAKMSKEEFVKMMQDKKKKSKDGKKKDGEDMEDEEDDMSPEDKKAKEEKMKKEKKAKK